jgi:hypothetical protein
MESGNGIGVLSFILLAGGGIITVLVCLTVDRSLRSRSR